jgi:hypothetical protein
LSKTSYEDLGPGGCLVVIVIVGLIMLGVDFLFMLAWNYVMPGVFGLPEITFWQAVAGLFVVGILTGGLRQSASKD